MVTLHIVLVHAEVIEVDKKTIQQNNPKGWTYKVGIETTKTEFTVGHADINHARNTTIHAGQNQIKNQQSPKRKQNALHHFRPNYRFHTAHNSIGNDTHACDDHDGNHIKPRKRLKTKGDTEKYGPHPGQLCQ